MSQEDSWEFEETEALPEDEVEPPLKYEIMNYPADTTLQGYVDMWTRGELVVPPFQRAFIWDQVRASKLIESFLLGLPVPGVFLFKPREESTYLIIDGQQRITSIYSFLTGVFAERVFKLKNVAPQWEGKRFQDLSDEEQFKLKGAVLRSTIIQQISPDDRTSIYQIFERLNTGGVNLSPMEIRQCVSFGPFIEFLKELNSDENWRKIIGKPKPDKRLRDVELILRCFALLANADNYEKPMKGFLNEYAENERLNPSNYPALSEAFKVACENIIQALGEKPFHLKGRLNYGAMDAVMFGLLSFGPREDLEDVFIGLQKTRSFMESITINTSDTVEVRTRIETVGHVFSGN